MTRGLCAMSVIFCLLSHTVHGGAVSQNHNAPAPGTCGNGFAAFAHHADLLVLHTALSDRAHAHPFASVIGLPRRLAALAAAAGVKQVILSHLMAVPVTRPDAADFSLFDAKELLAAVRSVYSGPVSLASHLRCVAIGGASR
jgi:ribonuclease BN (tRNA processing enzyme)